MKDKKLHLVSTKKNPEFMHFTHLFLKSVLWDQSFAPWIQYSWIITSNIQSIAILLYVQLQFVFKDELDEYSRFAPKISGFIALQKLFTFSDKVDVSIMSLTVIIFYFISLLTIIILVVRSLWSFKDTSRRSNYFIVCISQVHLAIGFWLTNMILMGYIKDKLMNMTEKGFTPGYIALFAITLSLIVINYMFGYLFATSSYDPFISLNVLSAHSPLYQQLTFLFQAISAPLIILVNNQKIQVWVLIVISLFILGIRQYQLISKYPFYQYLTMKVAIYLSSVSLFISVISFITIASGDINSFSPLNTLIIEAIAAFILKIFITTYMQSMISKYLELSIQGLKSVNDIFKKLFAVKYICENASLKINTKLNRTMSELQFWSAISLYERDAPKEVSEVCNLKESSIEEDQTRLTLNEWLNYYTKLGEKIQRDILKFAIEEHKKYNKFKVILAHLALVNDQPYTTITFHLSNLNKFRSQTKIIGQKLLDKLQLSVDQYLSENKEKIIDLKNYVDLEFMSSKFIDAIQSCSKKYVSFWMKYITDSQLSLKEILTCSKRIENEDNGVSILWKDFSKTNKIFGRSLCRIYSTYLNLVRGSRLPRREDPCEFLLLVLTKRLETVAQDFPISGDKSYKPERNRPLCIHDKR